MLDPAAELKLAPSEHPSLATSGYRSVFGRATIYEEWLTREAPMLVGALALIQAALLRQIQLARLDQLRSGPVGLWLDPDRL